MALRVFPVRSIQGANQIRQAGPISAIVICWRQRRLASRPDVSNQLEEAHVAGSAIGGSWFGRFIGYKRQPWCPCSLRGKFSYDLVPHFGALRCMRNVNARSAPAGLPRGGMRRSTHDVRDDASRPVPLGLVHQHGELGGIDAGCRVAGRSQA